MHFPAFSSEHAAIKQAPFSYVDEAGEELVTQWSGEKPKALLPAKLAPARVSKSSQAKTRQDLC